MEMSDDWTESLSKKVEEPNFAGYQLIGDSQFLRFSESIIGLKRKEKNGVFHLGFCVSGQTISELLRRVENRFADVSEKVVLMIGTNDLLRETSLEAMVDSFDQLLFLLRKYAKKIILLTIPPVPKLKNNEDHWNRLKKYNDFIRQRQNDKTIFVGDAYAKFIVPKTPRIKLSSSRSNSPNYGRSPKSTRTRDEKCRFTRPANGDKVRRREIPSNPSSDDEQSPPSKRCCPPPPPTPDRQAEIVRKKEHRRHFSDDLKNFDEACQPTAARSRCSSNSEFAFRSFGGFVRDLRKSQPENGRSSAASRTPPSERRFNSHSLPPTPSSDGDRSVPPRKPFSPAEKRRSCGSPATPSAGHGDSFKSPLRETFSGNCNSYRTPRSPFPSGEELLTSQMKRLNTVERNYSLDGLPTPPFSMDDSPATPVRKGRSYEKNLNLCGRAEDNHNDRYGQESIADEVNIENADSIREDCFEKYFCGDYRRPDLIHLNNKGFCSLKGIIEDIIDRIEETHSYL